MKTKQLIMLTAIIDFKDICDLFGQHGVITTGIAETLKEVLSEQQINELIKHLQTKNLTQWNDKC